MRRFRLKNKVVMLNAVGARRRQCGILTALGCAMMMGYFKKIISEVGVVFKIRSISAVPLNDNDKKSILSGALVLDCPVLELAPQSPSSTFSQYRGSGSVVINEAGHFDIKLYCPEQVPFDEVFAALNWKAGEIINESYYYRLTAVDWQGRRWQADGILLDPNTGPGGTVIIAKATKLTLQEESPISVTKHFLRLAFASKIGFPANVFVMTEKHVGGAARGGKHELSVAQFSAAGIEFEVEEDTGATYLFAKSEDVPFDEQAIDCIIAAFAFVTGNLSRWSLLEMRHETRVQATSSDHKRSRIGPPIQTAPLNHDVWVLFERYLSYGLKGAGAFHPLGALVRGILASGTVAIEVEALILSVSVETLLTTHFSNVMPADPDTERNIKIAKSLVNAAICLDESFRNRLIGSLATMKKLRAKDVLVYLRDRQLLEAGLVKTYGELRNKSAHGVDVNWAELQSHLNQCGAVLVLFYQLVFLQIGYTGQYTDYATYGYPLHSFGKTLT